MLFIFREGLGHTKPPKCSVTSQRSDPSHTVHGDLSSEQSPDTALQLQDTGLAQGCHTPPSPVASAILSQAQRPIPDTTFPASTGPVVPGRTVPRLPRSAAQAPASQLDFCPCNTKATHSGHRSQG